MIPDSSWALLRMQGSDIEVGIHVNMFDSDKQQLAFNFDVTFITLYVQLKMNAAAECDICGLTLN